MRRIIILLALMAGLSAAINVSGCMHITSSGTYDLVSDLQGANISAPEMEASGVTCIRIAANNVILDCHGHSVSENSTGSYRAGIMTRGNYTTIRNCVVTGYNGTGSRGISISQNSSLTVSRRIYYPRVDNVTCTNNYYGLRTNNYDSGSGLYGTIGLILSNSTFTQNRYGAYMSAYATNFTIINNNFSDNEYTGLYTSNLGARNVTIRNNTASFNRGSTNTNGGFYMEGLVANVTFTNNTAMNNSYYGLYIRSINTTISNNTISDNNASGIAYAPLYSDYGPYAIIANNTVMGNMGAGISQSAFDYPYYVSLFILNNTAAGNGGGISILGCVVGDVLGNIADNNTDYGLFFTSTGAGTGRDVLNLTVNGNRAFNNSRGIVWQSGTRHPYMLTFLNNTALENQQFDFFVPLSDLSTSNNCSLIDIGNLTSTGGRPIILINQSGDIRDYDVAELVLCGADNSTVANISIRGSDIIPNNGILLHKTSNSTFTNMSMSNDYASFDLIQSHNNRFYDITVDGSTYGVHNYHYFTSCCPTFRSSENNTFTNMNFTGCGTAYYFDFNALGSSNVTGGVIRDSYGPGIIVNTSLVFLNGTRFCNNNPDLRTFSSTGFAAYIGLNSSNLIFDSPSCSLADFTNMSITDMNAPANYTINWSAMPAAPPAGRFPFRGFVNLTRITTSTIERIVFHWTDAELGGNAENLFRLYKYNGTWTSMNSSPSTSQNTLSLFSVSSFSSFGILGADSAPTVTPLAPPSWSLFPSASVNLTFNTSDNSPALNCTLYLDSAANQTNASVITGMATNFSLEGISDGWHSWYVRCVDAANNAANGATRYIGVDTIPPEVDLDSPADWAMLGSGNVSFTYFTEDNVATVLNCSLYLDGNPAANDPSANDEGPMQFNVTGISDGAHEWRVECSDSFRSNSSGTWHFTVDSTPPLVMPASPDQNAIIYVPEANLSFNATDNLAAVMPCWLFINSTLNQTNASVINNTQAHFALAGLPLGPYSWHVVCSDGVNNGTGDTWDFTIALPPQEGGEDEPDPPLSIYLESTCGGNILTVTSRGNPVRGAEVEVEGNPAGSTDAEGLLALPGGCGRPIRIEAEKPGYRGVSGVRDLISCEECISEPPPPPPACACGFIFEGRCVEYECCSSDACDAAEYCDIPAGQAGGACRPVAGDCGEIANHSFVPYGYQCGPEPGCPSCPEGARCENHSCVTNDLKGPEEAVVGRNGTVQATENAGPCAFCDVEVQTPSGAIITGRTDAGGNFVLPFQSRGEYRVSLLRGGVAVRAITILALPAAAPEEPEKPAQTSPGEQFPWWLIILLLLIIAAIAYWRRRKKAKDAGKPAAGGGKPAGRPKNA